jgi:hypothetical protein
MLKRLLHVQLLSLSHYPITNFSEILYFQGSKEHIFIGLWVPSILAFEFI